MRPATASLVIGVVTQLVEAGVTVGEPELSGLFEMVGYPVTEDLQRTLDACARGDRRLSGSTQVGIVEVDEAVHSSADFAALPHLIPVGGGLRCSHLREGEPDRLPLPDDDPRDAADFPRLRGDAQPMGGPDEGHRGLGGRASDFERGGSTGLAERPRCEESAAPDGREIFP